MTKQRTCTITVNYRGAKDTAACVKSLMLSKVPLSIVVVDNTPNDSDLESALAPFPSVTILRAPENLGFGQGNNIGIEWAIEHTKSDFLFFLNNDAVVNDTTIAELENAMDAHPEAGMTTGRILLMDDLKSLWYGGGEVDWKRGGGITPGSHGKSDAPLAMTARYVSFASGCAMMVRRKVVEGVGGFDPRFFMYEEDVEWCLRIMEAGWRIWYEPKALIDHKEHGSIKDTGEKYHVGGWSPKNPKLPFLVYHMLKNRLLNMHLHAHGLNRLCFLPYFLVFICWKSANFFFHGRYDALRVIPKAWRSYRNQIATM